VVSEHVDGPPVHFVAAWAAINFKPFFRVAHPAALHVATGEQQVTVGSVDPGGFNHLTLSLVASLNVSATLQAVVPEFLQLLMSSLQQCSCLHLLTSAEHLFSFLVVVPRQTISLQVFFWVQQT